MGIITAWLSQNYRNIQIHVHLTAGVHSHFYNLNLMKRFYLLQPALTSTLHHLSQFSPAAAGWTRLRTRTPLGASDVVLTKNSSTLWCGCHCMDKHVTLWFIMHVNTLAALIGFLPISWFLVCIKRFSDSATIYYYLSNSGSMSFSDLSGTPDLFHPTLQNVKP